VSDTDPTRAATVTVVGVANLAHHAVDKNDPLLGGVGHRCHRRHDAAFSEIVDRDLDPYERGVLSLLTAQDFDGHQQLQKQLEGARVAAEYPSSPTIDLEVSPEYQEPAPVRHRVPVEAEGQDDDGATIYFLLFVDDEGVMSQLEIYRSDGETIGRLPEIATLTIPFILG